MGKQKKSLQMLRLLSKMKNNAAKYTKGKYTRNLRGIFR